MDLRRQAEPAELAHQVVTDRSVGWRAHRMGLPGDDPNVLERSRRGELDCRSRGRHRVGYGAMQCPAGRDPQGSAAMVMTRVSAAIVTVAGQKGRRPAYGWMPASTLSAPSGRSVTNR